MDKASNAKKSRSEIVAEYNAKASKKRDLFPIIMTASAILVVVVVVVAVIFGTKAENAPVVAPAAGVINEETGAIAIGTGPVAYDEYSDFGCNHCGDWHKKASTTVADAIAEDLITLNFHPIAILDNSFMGTEYSTRSANAAYCVAEANGDAVFPFADYLFKNQPAQGTEGLTDEQLIKYASAAGAPEAEACITEGKFKSYVAEMTLKTPLMPGAQGISTPTLRLDGEFFSPSEDPYVAITEAARNLG